MKKIAGIAVVIISMIGCNKNPQPAPTPPVAKVIPSLTTTAISAITRTTATSGGTIASDGGAPITATGICYAATPNPTISNNVIISGLLSGGFTTDIPGLVANTTYYVRAYATNSIGTGYGNEVRFTTNPITAPLVTSNTITKSTSQYSLHLVAKVTDDGGAPITSKGICYSSIHVPTISDTKTLDGIGIGTFTSTISNLSPNTTYILRAYATNSIGTAYGDSVMIVSDVEGNIYNTVKIGTQTWLLENLKTTKYNDGTSIPLVTVYNLWWAFGQIPTPKYCWYNNDIRYKDSTGALYNFEVVKTGLLAPPGWHVPTQSDVKVFFKFLDPSFLDTALQLFNTDYHLYRSVILGGKIKEIGTVHWDAPNTGATNESGFTGFGGGTRNDLGGDYGYIRMFGMWWTSTEIKAEVAAYRLFVGNNTANSYCQFEGVACGHSVRCIKN